MTNLKQGRWVKIHEPGQANYAEKENIMDITVGNNRCQAEVTYTVRSYRKAAHWLLKYLEVAGAIQILSQVTEQIQTAALEAHRESPEVRADGTNWKCEMEKMCQGVFKVTMAWVIDEPIVTKGRKKKAVAQATA